MLELIGALTVWFWVWLLLEIVVLTYTTEKNCPGWGILAVLVGLPVLQWLIGIPVFQWIWDHPFWTVGLAGLYFVVGTNWSIIKWYFFVQKKVRKYNKLRDEFLVMCKAESVTEDLKKGLHEFLKTEFGCGYMNQIKPNAKNFKGQIMTWIGFWPFSFVWTLLNDPLRRLVESIYYRIAAFLQKISDHLFKDIEQELTITKKENNNGL